jgi:hypothetical protein
MFRETDVAQPFSHGAALSLRGEHSQQIGNRHHAGFRPDLDSGRGGNNFLSVQLYDSISFS